MDVSTAKASAATGTTEREIVLTRERPAEQLPKMVTGTNNAGL